MDAVTALSYIFEGTLHDNLRKIVPLHVIIQNSSIQHEIGVVRLKMHCLKNDDFRSPVNRVNPLFHLKIFPI